MGIHATAIVDTAAELAAGVTVGPYAVIGAGVKIGAGTTIGAHTVIEGPCTIGRDNRIHAHTSLGGAPQDMKYRGEPTLLSIGDRNTIHEFCTFNRGTVQDGGITRIGDDNWIMAYVHVAHDCQLGSHLILANAVQLAGHVHLGDWVFLGGLSGVHQFVRVGAHAMTGFQTRLSQDLPPFVTAAGNPAAATGINQEGLRRRGYTAERIARVKQMHRALYRQGLSLTDSMSAVDALRASAADAAADPVAASEAAADIDLMLGFLRSASRGIVR